MNDVNLGVKLSILGKTKERRERVNQSQYETADADIQALQETAMALIDLILMLAGPEFKS